MKNALSAVLCCALICSVFTSRSADFYSTANGIWENAIWSKISHAAPATDALGCNTNKTVFIEHTVTSNCDPFKFSGGADITVRSGGKLIINFDADLSGGTTVTVEAGGEICFLGDLKMTGGATITTTGVVVVQGETDVAGAGQLICIAPGYFALLGPVDSDIDMSDPCYLGGILPIELYSFDAYNSNYEVIVRWETASELNNSYFTIEKSIDGEAFYEIAQINGAGNSSTRISYEITDESPSSGNSFYRLKQTDFDGTTETFEPVSVFRQQTETIKMYPNPTTGILKVVESSGKKSTSIAVYTMNSELVEILVSDDGVFNLGHFAQGVYFVRVKSNGQTFTKKVVIQY